MKKILTILLCVPMVCLMNCGLGDDETDNGEEFFNALVGSWMMTSLTNTGCTNTEINGTLDMNHSASFTVVIGADRSFMIIECGQVVETSKVQEVTATTITICDDGATDCEPEVYTLSGNSLTVVSADVSETGDEAGCQSTFVLTKDMDPAEFAEPYIGTWILASMTFSNCPAGGTQSDGTEDCPENCAKVVMNENCTYESYDDGLSLTSSGFLIIGDGWVLACSESDEEECSPNPIAISTDGNTLMFTETAHTDFGGCDVTFNLVKQ